MWSVNPGGREARPKPPHSGLTLPHFQNHQGVNVSCLWTPCSQAYLLASIAPSTVSVDAEQRTLSPRPRPTGFSQGQRR